jgi:hypothetical protein
MEEQMTNFVQDAELSYVKTKGNSYDDYGTS